MNEEELIFERSGRTATLHFNRPAVHNAANLAMYARLEEACEAIDADEGIRVTVLRGSGGKAFIAGTDISHFRGFDSTDDAIAYETLIDRIVGRVERLKCTTLAVLEGVCAGGGVPIALACDFRLAADNLRFGVPIAKTLGNCLSLANIARLIDFLGVARTKELLMLGQFLDAGTAERLGIVSGVFAADALDDAVDGLVADILVKAPLTLRAVKIAVRRTLEFRRASPEFAEDLIRLCYGSDDFHQGVNAFLEGRRHDWQGR